MSCARGCCASRAEHYKSLRVGADRHTRMSNGFTLDTDRAEARDMDAYRRLRKQGLQPPDWTGCARLEATASSRTEIEIGRTLDKATLAVLEAS